MIGLFILLLFLMTIILHLLVAGSNINKTDKEKSREDKEQQKYLDDYSNRKIIKKINKKKKNQINKLFV